MLDATKIHRLRIFFRISSRKNAFVLSRLFDIRLCILLQLLSRYIRLLNIFYIQYGSV